MGLTKAERTAFATSYTRTLVNAWSDDHYLRTLQAEPRATLTQAGIELPDHTQVTIIRTVADPSGDGGVEAQVDLYEQGLRSGSFEFYLPQAPEIDTAELDASELQGVAAGGIYDPYCCSCCPSCCSASGSG